MPEISTPDIIAYVLILISALFKGVALRALKNPNAEFEIRKKKYMKLNLLSYACLVPGLIIFAYFHFIL